MKGSKKRRGISGKLHPIFCPYCMRTFQANNVVFRKQALPYGAGNVDDPYIQMYNDLFFKRTPVSLPRTIDPAYIEDEKDKGYDEDGMLVMVKDVEGDHAEARDRICSYCHNKLVKLAGKLPNHTLSVVGFVGCGKTTYEAALIDALRMDHVGCLNVSNCGNLNAIEKNIATLKRDEELNSTLTEEGPFHYQTSFNHAAGTQVFLLNMVDLPGESFRNVNAIETIGHAIPKSDTCIFLVDLENKEEAIQVFGTLVGSYGNQLKSGRINVAVVLYKADKLTGLFPETPEFLTFRRKRDYSNCAPVNLERIKNNHEQIVTFVVNDDPMLSSLYTSLKCNIPERNLRWFAAFSRKNGKYAPNNVEEPLLWSLAMKKMYPIV